MVEAYHADNSWRGKNRRRRRTNGAAPGTGTDDAVAPAALGSEAVQELGTAAQTEPKAEPDSEAQAARNTEPKTAGGRRKAAEDNGNVVEEIQRAGQSLEKPTARSRRRSAA